MVNFKSSTADDDDSRSSDLTVMSTEKRVFGKKISNCELDKSSDCALHVTYANC